MDDINILDLILKLLSPFIGGSTGDVPHALITLFWLSVMGRYLVVKSNRYAQQSQRHPLKAKEA